MITLIMDMVNVKGFFLVGISVRTANTNGQSVKDLGELWGRFMKDDVMLQIEDRIGDDIYCVYTDYETDHNGYYTAVLGCRIGTPDNIPIGLIHLTIAPGRYEKHIAKGKLPDCVTETWQHIWNNSTNRTYITDFDLYSSKAQNPQDAEVEVYVGVK